MDTSLFRAINDFAGRSDWLHGPATAYAKYGVVIFALLMVWAWLRARRTGDLHTEAGIGWAGVATVLALALGQIVGRLVDRSRPYATLRHVHVLVSRTADSSFPSDHALAVGAVAVGLWLVDRTVGTVAVALAVLMAVTRVYAGAHYPSDVLAGLVLAGLVGLVGARPGTRVLEAILERVNRLPGASLVSGRPAQGSRGLPE